MTNLANEQSQESAVHSYRLFTEVLGTWRLLCAQAKANLSELFRLVPFMRSLAVEILQKQPSA